MAHAQIFYTNSARFASQLAPGSSYETINLLPSIWQGGGLKSIASIDDVWDLYNTDSWIPQTRRQTGSIIYDRTTGKYYKDTGGAISSSGYVELAVLNGGLVSFAGITSSAGIYIQSGNLVLNGGNIATTGTASFGATTVSGLKSNGIISGSSTLNIVGTGTFGDKVTANAGFRSTGVSDLSTITSSVGVSASLLRAGAGITTSGYLSVQGNASVQGTLGVTGISTLGITNVSNLSSTGTISAVTGFTSSAGYLRIGGAATSSTGFYSPGTSNLTTLNVATISGSGLATLTDLYVPGNTQLGNATTDTTSVWGTLNVVHDSSNSGSITSDANGNLILDGSGAAGVQIVDGNLLIGAIQFNSGSYGGAYAGGMLSSSAKIVAVNGFANAGSDTLASFEVDASGNLQCYSLKETSLREYKHEIHYITESQLLNISKLKPITFLYNIDNPQDINDTQLRQAGFIAEQVQQIYPEVAWYKQGKLAGLQYQRLTAYLTRGIQQLVQQNKKLSHRLDLKDKAITKLNKRVTQLQKIMNTVLEKIG